MKSLPLLLLCCGLLLAGCSSLTTHRADGLAKVKRIYVEHLLTDNLRLDQLIVAELKGLGYDASCGPITMMPEGVDAIITYRARSAWDFKSYLIEMSFEMKANFSGDPLASGRYYQPSLRTKSPEDVVRELVTSIFKKK